jgi:hypothetical protein
MLLMQTIQMATIGIWHRMETLLRLVISQVLVMSRAQAMKDMPTDLVTVCFTWM